MASSFNEAESQEHKRLVSGLIKFMQSNGWQITHADSDGYNRPPPVETHIPDVRATNSDNSLIAYGEAETCATLPLGQSLEQMSEFSNRQMSTNHQEVPLFVVVPQACFNQLKETVAKNFPARKNITCLYQPA